MASYRKNKVANEIKKIIAQTILTEVKDPRIELVSITHASVSNDLQIAHLSWLSSSNRTKQDIQKALDNAKPFLRTVLAKKLNIRKVPQLNFHYDDNFEKANHMMELIDKLKKDGQMGTSENESQQ